MAIEIRTADRKQVFLKLGLSGLAGSGKTMSALRLARGMASDWSKILLIDTEKGTGELYSHLGPYLYIKFDPPHSPLKYIEYIKTALTVKPEVIIIDSITHEWEGEGGCLDEVEVINKKNPKLGPFQAWNDVTPKHRAFIDYILGCPAHVILTTRKKSEYTIEKDEQTNKTKVQKVGLKNNQREGLEYEWSIEFEIDQTHQAIVSKDRTGIFSDIGVFQITEETGEIIRKWNQSGSSNTKSIIHEQPPELKKIIKSIQDLAFNTGSNPSAQYPELYLQLRKNQNASKITGLWEATIESAKMIESLLEDQQTAIENEPESEFPWDDAPIASKSEVQNMASDLFGVN